MGFTLSGTRISIGLPFIGLIAAYALLGLGLEAAIAFLSLAAHEAAHAMAASAYDLDLVSVELTPFGGVERLGGLLEQDPYVETSVALAGPASSFMLAGLAALLWRAGILPPGAPGLMVDVNVMLGLVNLLPVLPLDGGRVARANLSKSMGYARATKTIGRIGRALSLAAIVLVASLWFINQILLTNVLIYAVFGYIFAGKESKAASITSLSLLMRRKQNLARQGVILTQQLTAMGHVPIEQVARAFSSRRYSSVTILDDRHSVIGSISEGDIVELILSGNGRMTLAQALVRR